MATEYNLPCSIISNRRMIKQFTVKQGGIPCEYYQVNDKRNMPIGIGPLSFIGVKNLVDLHSQLGRGY